MKELQGKELEDAEEFYQANFAESYSDEDFNPSNGEVSGNTSVLEESNVSIEKEIENKNILVKKDDKKADKDIIDIDMLDLDKIDEMEDMRDKGIDVDIEDMEDNSSEEISSEDKTKRKKKKKFRKKKNNLLLLNFENEDKKKGRNFIDDEVPLINKKRNRNIIIKRKKEKRRFNNKNVFYDEKSDYLVIKQNALNNPNEENDRITEHNLNEKDVMKYNDNSFGFRQKMKKNLEEENQNTKNIIKKYKKEQKANYIEKFSQKDFLLEAIFTEWQNIESLKEIQKLEDLNKKEIPISEKKTFTEFIRYRKKITQKDENDRKNLITFSNPEIFKKLFENFNKKPEIKEKHFCAITGKEAKYFDPLTKSYYSNIESFKLLREKYFQKEEDGLLFRIQTLSDLASQKKEKLKKIILSNEANNQQEKTLNLLNIVNKIGIIKNEINIEGEKKIISRNYLFI